eukprot:1608051-Amphidinium_carterae.1
MELMIKGHETKVPEMSGDELLGKLLQDDSQPMSASVPKLPLVHPWLPKYHWRSMTASVGELCSLSPATHWRPRTACFECADWVCHFGQPWLERLGGP